jgi:hypothetical protein
MPSYSTEPHLVAADVASVRRCSVCEVLHTAAQYIVLLLRYSRRIIVGIFVIQQPKSFLDDDVFISLDMSFDDDQPVTPSGRHDCRTAQDGDLSMAGQRHLVDFASCPNSSPIAMETSFTGLMYNSETSYSRTAERGTTLKTRRLHYTVN